MNKIIQGNCEQVLRDIGSDSIDLIYLDPPFNNGYFMKESMWKYIQFMRTVLFELHRVLKDTGSIYLHCDPTASHYLKIIMDNIFGIKNFQNEIIWHYGLGSSNRRTGFLKKHDIILFYSKNKKFNFNPIMVSATSNRMKGKKKKEDDVWNIPTLNNMAKERTGYPTQKPLALLERIIKASSNEGDIVLDPFCGSGTTLVAAKRLGRRYIGIDKSDEAIQVSKKRVSE